jgi:hypothetical protein
MSQFFWPQMSSHIDKYVVWCAHYQRNKRYNSSTRGIPQPHAVSSCRFDVVSVDFLSGFPTTKNGYDCIVVFTDRLTLRTYISPCQKSISAKDLDTIFVETVFRHQGMSRVVCLIMGPNSLVNFGNNFLRFWGLTSDSLQPTILNLMVFRRSSTRL